MALPIKKIYIDTKFKTHNSISNSHFNVELPMSVTFPDNSVFYIDDVSIPHSWCVIESGINDRLFIYSEQVGKPSNHLYNVVPIDPGNYIGTDLAKHINDTINIVVNLLNYQIFSCVVKRE